MDWFDLLAVQGTLKSLLQHHSSKASTLQCSYHGLYRWALNVLKISCRSKKSRDFTAGEEKEVEIGVSEPKPGGASRQSSWKR